MKLRYISFALVGTLTMSSCDKFLDTQTEGQIVKLDEFITSDEEVKLVLNAYDVMGNTFDGNIQNMAELISSNAGRPGNDNWRAVWSRETTFFNDAMNGVYTNVYRIVNRANLVLEYLNRQTETEEVIRMKAEAHFLRGMAHFAVLKVYAQPWGYTANNSHLGIVIRETPNAEPKGRSTVAECYSFIQGDLFYAYNNLPVSNGVYATKYAAAATLAYTYYMQNNYQRVVDYTTEIIESGLYTLAPDVDVFYALNDSAMVYNTPEGIFFAHSNASLSDARNDGFRNNYMPGTSPTTFSLSLDFLQFMQLNEADQRYQRLVQNNSNTGQVQSMRFGISNQNNAFFSVPISRLTVMMLIRAEAYANLNSNLDVAIADINRLRDRAFPGTPFHVADGTAGQALIDIIQEEFRKETFCEGYWVDVERRNGIAGENVMIRNAPWNCPGMALQFPNSEGTGADFVFNTEGGCN
jgi:starch-binding outer membrane protein, SusD/RagB family